MNVKPLDAGQEREVAFARSQRSAWVNLSAPKRWLRAVIVIALTAVIFGGIAALVHGPWLLLGLGGTGLGFLVVLPHALAPEWMLRLSVRSSTPTADAMKGGDSNRNWPG